MVPCIAVPFVPTTPALGRSVALRWGVDPMQVTKSTCSYFASIRGGLVLVAL